MALEMTWKLSKAGVLVSILAAIMGCLIWIGTEIWNLSAVLTALQVEQAMLVQDNQNLAAALRQETSKREMDERNMDRILWAVADIHNRGRK
jgi:hypothetical protein